MKYIQEIIKENKKPVKKKSAKKKIIVVAIQETKTMYLKVYAHNNVQAEKIAKSWFETGDDYNKIVKIASKKGSTEEDVPAIYFNGPVTNGYTAEILGQPIETWIKLDDD